MIRLKVSVLLYTLEEEGATEKRIGAIKRVGRKREQETERKDEAMY